MQTDPNITDFCRELAARPRAGTLAATVDNVRRTCVALAGTPECLVRIDEERAISFVKELDIEVVEHSSHYMDVPVEFRDVQSEVCFHVTLHLFNFGHGFRHALNKLCGVGAWQTTKRGIEALHATVAKRSTVLEKGSNCYCRALSEAGGFSGRATCLWRHQGLNRSLRQCSAMRAKESRHT